MPPSQSPPWPTPAFAKRRRGRRARFRQDLTDSFVEDLQPQETEFSVHDWRVSGLQVRVQPTGTKSYEYVPPQANGRRRKFTLGRAGEITSDVARDRAVSILTLGDAGKSLGTVPGLRSKRRMIDALPGYQSYCRKSMSAEWCRKVELTFERAIVPRLGTRPLGKITREDIRELIHSVTSAPASRRQIHFIVSSFLKWALERRWIDQNVLTGSLAPPAKVRRAPSLGASDLAAIWCANGKLPWPWNGVFGLVLLTGRSLAEVRSLRNDAVDRQARIWRVAFVSGDDWFGESVALSDAAMTLVAAEDANKTYAFSRTRDGMPMAFQQGWMDRLRDLSGVGQFTCRDLQRAVVREIGARRQGRCPYEAWSTWLIDEQRRRQADEDVVQ